MSLLTASKNKSGKMALVAVNLGLMAYIGQTEILKIVCFFDFAIERIKAVLRYFHWTIL